MIRDWAPAILPVIAYELDPALGAVKQLVCNDMHEIYAATTDRVYKTTMPAGGDPLVWNPKKPILSQKGVGNGPLVVSHNTTLIYHDKTESTIRRLDTTKNQDTLWGAGMMDVNFCASANGDTWYMKNNVLYKVEEGNSPAKSLLRGNKCPKDYLIQKMELDPTNYIMWFIAWDTSAGKKGSRHGSRRGSLTFTKSEAEGIRFAANGYSALTAAATEKQKTGRGFARAEGVLCATKWPGSKYYEVLRTEVNMNERSLNFFVDPATTDVFCTMGKNLFRIRYKRNHGRYEVPFETEQIDDRHLFTSFVYDSANDQAIGLIERELLILDIY